MCFDESGTDGAGCSRKVASGYSAEEMDGYRKGLFKKKMFECQASKENGGG